MEGTSCYGLSVDQLVADGYAVRIFGPDVVTVNGKAVSSNGNGGGEEQKKKKDNFTAKQVNRLADNACAGLDDLNRNGPMDCLKAFASNLAALYAKSPELFKGSDMIEALQAVADMGLLGDKQLVSPTLNGVRQTSATGNFTDPNTTTNIPDALLKIIGDKQGIYVFAVGLAANYHSTLAIVVNAKLPVCDMQASKSNPVFIMVEDYGGARIFNKSGLDSKYLEYYQTAAPYYNGTRPVGGRSGTGKDSAMEAYIYQLFRH
jgi:hypothetical protein